MLTDQQLRLRLQVLDELDLVITRQGRFGTMISREGNALLAAVQSWATR